MPKSFEKWYTDTFGGCITKEQASDAERIAYDYYVDNFCLTEEDVKSQKAKVVYELQIANLKAMLKTERELKCNDDFLKRIAELEAKADELEDANKDLKQCLDWANEREGEYMKLIEKMKCCENCKHHSFWGDELKCNLDLDTQFKCLHTKEKWELAEN